METPFSPLIAVVSGLFVALLISWSSLTYTIPPAMPDWLRTFSGGIDPSESPDQGFHFKAPWDRGHL